MNIRTRDQEKGWKGAEEAGKSSSDIFFLYVQTGCIFMEMHVLLMKVTAP